MCVSGRSHFYAIAYRPHKKKKIALGKSSVMGKTSKELIMLENWLVNGNSMVCDIVCNQSLN